MKKIILLALMGLFSMSALADHVISDEEYRNLPEETRIKLETSKTLGNASSYASLGKEIGTAVNETLLAIEGSAERISKTDLGRTAISICVWKLLWKDITKLVIGLILLGTSISFTIWIFRKYCINPSEHSLEIIKSTEGTIYFLLVLMCILPFAASMICIFA